MPKVLKYVTLPHFGCLGMVWLIHRLRTTQKAAMRLEVIFCQRLRKGIDDLFFHVDGKDLDESLPNMLTKVMVAYVDVLGART